MWNVQNYGNYEEVVNVVRRVRTVKVFTSMGPSQHLKLFVKDTKSILKGTVSFFIKTKVNFKEDSVVPCLVFN